jgi:hypothetical protein
MTMNVMVNQHAPRMLAVTQFVCASTIGEFATVPSPHTLISFCAQ